MHWFFCMLVHLSLSHVSWKGFAKCHITGDAGQSDFCVGLYLQIFVHKRTYVLLINSGRRRCLLVASSPSETGRQHRFLLKQAKLLVSQRKHSMALC